MSDKKLLVKAVVFGSVCGMLVTVILMCVFAAIIMAGGLLPAEITNYIGVGILSCGTFFGGFVTSKITKSAGLVVGIITGFIIFLIITAMGMAKSDEALTVLTLVRFILLVIFGGVGGIFGLKKREKIRIK